MGNPYFPMVNLPDQVLIYLVLKENKWKISIDHSSKERKMTHSWHHYQCLKASMKEHVSIQKHICTYFNLYICIEKKLFGNVSVNDIVKASNKLSGCDSEFGVAGYTLNPKLVHGFNRNHMVPKQKLKRYLDSLMEAKAKLPGPDKYECNVHKKEFNDMTKKSKIYTHERRSSVLDTMNEAKKLPGVGKYETTAFDEKRCRPPRGLH